MRQCRQSLGYLLVFSGATAVEVVGQQFERARLGYYRQRQYWLRSVFAGSTWASARLNQVGTDVRWERRQQLEPDVAPLRAGEAGV